MWFHSMYSTFMTESIRKMADPSVTLQNNDACEVLRLGKLYPIRHMTSKRRNTNFDATS